MITSDSDESTVAAKRISRDGSGADSDGFIQNARYPSMADSDEVDLNYRLAGMRTITGSVTNCVGGAQRLETVRERAGRPYYGDDRVLLYNLDCQELMRRIGSPVVDLTVTSPPYNIGKEYECVRRPEDYLAWCGAWMRQIFEITDGRGAFWLNLGYFELPGRARAVPISYLLWNRTPFYLMQEIVWHYRAGVSAKRRFAPRNEKYLWYVKNGDSYTFNLDAVRDPDVAYPKQKKNGKLRCNPLGKNPTDVWEIPKVTSGRNRSSPERTGHPAQSPLAVLDRIIRASSNIGDLVFDPFVGSGSTAVSCVASGRKVIGCDTNAGYLDVAVERIRAAG